MKTSKIRAELPNAAKSTAAATSAVTPNRKASQSELTSKPIASMRTIHQSPVVKVKAARPYVAARQRWKERMATEQQRRLEQRGSVCYRDHADATHERHSDGGRDDCEEREPLMNESAPLRFSQEREEGRCDGSTANFTTAATRLGDDNVRPLTCRVMVDNDVQKPGRISLAGLVRNKPGALSSSTPNPGDVTSIDRRMQSLAVAQQQARKHAQKLIKDKSVATRRRILMNTLGMQKFYKALALIREVKGIRENLLRSCAAEDPLSKSAARGKIRVCKQKFEALPKPGRDLLSKTDLVASLERTELDRLGKLRWDELIQQAQENLFAYREWVSISETRE